MQDPSSPTRIKRRSPALGVWSLTTGLPGKSLLPSALLTFGPDGFLFGPVVGCMMFSITPPLPCPRCDNQRWPQHPCMSSKSQGHPQLRTTKWNDGIPPSHAISGNKDFSHPREMKPQPSDLHSSSSHLCKNWKQPQDPWAGGWANNLWDIREIAYVFCWVEEASPKG